MKRDRCKHYNGLQHTACRAEVRYAEVTADGRRPTISNTPCFGHGDKCLLREWPTEEEIAAEEALIAQWLSNYATARRAIVEAIGPHVPGRDFQGVIDCPCCGTVGALHYTRSGYNGHIHGQCAQGCVEWME